MKYQLLYDGNCGLCNKTVQIVMKNDSKKSILFVAQQSDEGKQILKQHGLDTPDFDSFVFVVDNQAFIRSEACIELCKYLGGIWKMGLIFKFLPKFLRDSVYNFIAKNRLLFFKKTNSCQLHPQVKEDKL